MEGVGIDMFLGVILGNKIVISILAGVLVIPPIAYGGIKVNEYRQTQIIVQEAKQLSLSGKYQEAINKLAESDSKWSFGGVKKEVEGLKEENKTLIQATVEYELGKELFDKDKYKDALEILKKVDSRNINYPSAISLIELAEKKLEAAKGDVAGVKTEVKKTTQRIIEPSPTPLPTALPTVTPESQKPQHTDSYCKNEAKLAVIKLDEELSRITREESPWLFSYEAYLKQFPDAEIGSEAWQQFAKKTYYGYKQYAVREGEKLYFKTYNQCLGY